MICDKLYETNIPRNLILDEGVIKRLSNIITGKTTLEIEIFKSIVVKESPRLPIPS